MKFVQRVIELPLAQSEPMQTPELISATHDVLMQGLELLLKLDDSTFSQVASVPYNASIGQHYRHLLEHFHCLVNGAPAGEIDYDARERNRRLETEVSYACDITCDVLRTFKSYSEEMLQRKCMVIHSVGYGTGKPSTIESNIGRELAYCVGHAIHHYAIIRLVSNALNVSVSPEFGFAPSTLKHMSSLAAD